MKAGKVRQKKSSEDMKALGIIGASGHGKVVADIAAKTGYTDIFFFDDDESIGSCGGYPVLGISRNALETEAELFVAVGNAYTRQCLQGLLEAEGKTLPVLIHPGSVVAADAVIGPGSVIMAGAVVNPGCTIGRGCIVNTCASVDHDCDLGDYVHIAVGAHLAGTVTVGDRTWVGAGATVSNNIRIAVDSVIGAGAVVIRNIDRSGTYIGVPAREKTMRQSGKPIRGGNTRSLRAGERRPVRRAA